MKGIEMAKHVVTRPVTDIRIGTVIAEGKRRFRVETITPCRHKRHGVPKVHVNNRFCYDTAGYVDVMVSD